MFEDIGYENRQELARRMQEYLELVVEFAKR